jgi:hypothetical protein
VIVEDAMCRLLEAILDSGWGPYISPLAGRVENLIPVLQASRSQQLASPLPLKCFSHPAPNPKRLVNNTSRLCLHSPYADRITQPRLEPKSATHKPITPSSAATGAPPTLRRDTRMQGNGGEAARKGYHNAQGGYPTSH